MPQLFWLLLGATLFPCSSNDWTTLCCIASQTVLIHWVILQTQFEIECRTCGQSLVNFKFFNYGVKNYFMDCHSWFQCAFCETYKKWEFVFQNNFFNLFYFFSSFQPTVHNGRVSRGGSVATAVGLVTGDTWQVTGDRWHMRCDMWHVTHDIWHVTCDMWHMTKVL